MASPQSCYIVGKGDSMGAEIEEDNNEVQTTTAAHAIIPASPVDARATRVEREVERAGPDDISTATGAEMDCSDIEQPSPIRTCYDALDLDELRPPDGILLHGRALL